MPVCGIKVIPLGAPSTSLSRYVADCLKVLEEFPELQYRLTPNETVVEGDLDTILKALRKMHEVPFQQGIQRVLTVLTIDDRRDKPLTMESKIQSVEEKRKAP